MKFKPEESSTSEHNKAVLAMIIKDVSCVHDCKFNLHCITAATWRRYQNLRRVYTEVQSGKENHIEKQAKQCIFGSHRLRIYNRRKRTAKDGEELRRWIAISQAYMIEESVDASDTNVLITHNLTWRSETLNSFILVLDERYNSSAAAQRDGTGNVVKKIGINGEPSNSLLPVNAPLWAIYTL